MPNETAEPTDGSIITRTCPLCEAMCGLRLEMDPTGEIVRVRGDRSDPYSRGFICPKGSQLKQIDADPDRLDGPRVRRDRKLVPVSWTEAFEEAGRLLRDISESHGHDAVGLFLGNSISHDVGIQLLLPLLHSAVRSKNVFSSATLDNMPHNVVASLLFGHGGTIPVPDVDRTHLLVIVGANPVVSNGSVGAAPDYPGRLRALRVRGGRLVVIDPVETQTARIADLHVTPYPGTDALLLLSIAATFFDEGLVRLGRLEPYVDGLAGVEHALAGLLPEDVAERCGVAAGTIRALARDIVRSPSAAVYGRLGTTLNEFGTLASWGIMLVNILSGHLDRPGGMMFPESVAGSPTTRPGTYEADAPEFGRQRTVVRGAPQILGEFPAACLAEEVLNDSPDRIRGMIVLGGNPARSIPNSAHVERALEHLDALVCIGPYIDETSRHADVILPPAGPLSRPHFDVLLTNYSLRNVAKYSGPARPLRPGELEEWRLIARLAGAIDRDLQRPDDEHLARRRDRLAASLASEFDMSAQDLIAELDDPDGLPGILDLRIRSGPFGDRFGRRPGGLTLADLQAAEHTVDLGPLRSRIGQVVRLRSGRINIGAAQLVADVDRLRTWLSSDVPPLTLIGRRELRSKNSWLHNIPRLVSGRPRCTLRLHPDDAAEAGLANGSGARVVSATGSIEVDVEFDQGMRRSVCSLPHGWGHDVPGTGRRVADANPGVNSNLLSDDRTIDPLSGSAVLNGIRVTVHPLRLPSPEGETALPPISKEC